MWCSDSDGPTMITRRLMSSVLWTVITRLSPLTSSESYTLLKLWWKKEINDRGLTLSSTFVFTHTRRHRWVSALSPGWEAGIGVVASWSNINSIPGDRATGGSVLKDQPDTVCVCERHSIGFHQWNYSNCPSEWRSLAPLCQSDFTHNCLPVTEIQKALCEKWGFFYLFFYFFYPWLTLQLTQRQISQQQ